MTTTRSPKARPRPTRSRSATTRPVLPAELTLPVRSLWLAGLGTAFAAGEAATAFVDRLVAEGRVVEPKVAARAREVADETRERVGAAAVELASRARGVADSALERAGFTPRRQKNLFHRLGDLAEAIL